MGRILPDSFVRAPAETAPVAWSDDFDFEGDGVRGVIEYRSCMAQSPFKKGDVILIERNGKAVKACIFVIHPIWGMHRGSYMLRYRVSPMTADGRWSRQWLDVWPRTIERGYALAAKTA